ncbi:hypothetical protein BJ165DRAFT_1526445 [Panaeolus papilionaceus]|nr:hypothetical protein BJ165DRAFT_1526445 [Panaeolus papilionaceus]
MAMLPDQDHNIGVVSIQALWACIFPSEIIFHIIDTDLSDDSHALHSLSLTCRVIHAYTRRYLFNDIILRSGEMSLSNVPNFVAIVHSSSSILLAVRRLHVLLGSYTGYSQEQQITNVDALCWIMKQEFPNLTHLRLCVSESASTLVGQTLQFQSSLSLLLASPKLSNLKFLGYGPLNMALLEQAVHVRDLTIQTVRQPSADGAVVTQGPARIRPVTLNLYSPPWKSSILTSMHCDFSAISTFRFYGLEQLLIRPYLANFSSTLTRLEIYLNFRAYTQGPPRLDLRALVKLRHLTTTLNAKFWNGTHSHSHQSVLELQWLIDMLGSLPAPCVVESIRILTRCTAFDDLRNVDWAMFDGLVFGSHMKWSSLKSLDFVFFLQYSQDLAPLGMDFQDIWMPTKLRNFRQTTDAVLNVKLEAGRTITAYAPEDLQG